jgi:signal transduction histidine kinase
VSKTSNFRFWPRSLYGQILLVAALALLVAQSINAYMLLAGARNRSILEASTMLVGRVANQIEREAELGIPIGIADARSQRRQNRSFRRPSAVSLSLNTAPLNIPGYENQSELSARASDFLAQSGINLASVRLSFGSLALLPDILREPQIQRIRAASFRQADRPIPRQAVLFSARMSDGRWINAATVVRPNEAGSVLALLLQTLTLYIAVMIPLALVARRIAKPLGRLTERVQRVGLTDKISPMPSKGPTDIRQLVDAFNTMQTRVVSLLGEKDVMLGAIGHDLKTPLAALRVRVESVEDDAEREKMAATIDEMVKILDDILMLARLGKSGEMIQSVDIGALVESISDEFEHTTFDEPGQRLVAEIRPVLLRRALRNLISNAVTYGKQATISLRRTPTHLTIEITDKGPGIEASQIDAMFEPFSRAETSRSRATGGSGLGLTIARAIARSHSGDVILENRPEGGLKATLTIALKPALGGVDVGPPPKDR